jgi:SAM-dependent methyltransferase
VFFDVSADAYGRFMGRYAEPLAGPFAAYAGVGAGDRVLDVGCGPGALTARLVDTVGLDAVAAVDPSAPFVDAIGQRLPGLDVRAAAAEDLPFADDGFDRALAQLVVHFMSDPVGGLREMARVTRPGGTVAACVWDHGGGRGPLSPFWQGVHDVDPSAAGEGHLPGSREGHLAELFTEAGLADVEQTELEVTVGYETFEEWWEPYTAGVGPAGRYVAELRHDRRELVREACAALLPAAPFEIRASAWTVRGRVPSP